MCVRTCCREGRKGVFKWGHQSRRLGLGGAGLLPGTHGGVALAEPSLPPCALWPRPLPSGASQNTFGNRFSPTDLIVQFFREHIQGAGSGWDPYSGRDGHSNPRGPLHSLPRWVSVRMKGTGHVRCSVK